ncbi:Protein BZZ1 [Coemansia sp. RSA 552]|nr:Protein BZZ1 [Coemansia sp. RSA 552]
MTFGAELKPNEFGAVNGYVERQLEIYGGLSKLLAEKAAAEREYGRRVVDLARGFQEQLSSVYEPREGAGIGSLALTDTEAAASDPLELLPAANEWALRLEEEGRLHVQLASKIGGDIADELQRDMEALGEARRHSLDFYQRLLVERDRAYEQKDKARAQYEARSKALGASRQRQERATSEKEQDKYRQKAERETGQCNQAKNEYVLHVAVANEVKNAVNRTFTPRVMDAMETIDQQRVGATRRFLLQMLNMQQAAEARLAAGTQRAAHVVGRVASEVDAAQYVRRRIDSGQSQWDEPPDFRVVVDVAAGEDDSMALDGESQVILRNMCVHAQREGVRAEQEARTQAQEAEQARQQQDPAEGLRGLDRIFGAQRKSTMAELEAVQHQALRAAVEQRLGPVDQGNPHEFKAHTVAISKTCDYCGDTIGGLNRKSARCAQCEYTCHAKCQIKVQPTCPGPDPEAKGGFLSLFGSKRGRRKSRAHKRSESGVSGASVGSVDSARVGPPPPAMGAYGTGGTRSRSSSSASAAQPTLPARPGGGGYGATMSRMSMSPATAASLSPGPPLPGPVPVPEATHAATMPSPSAAGADLPDEAAAGRIRASVAGRASTAPGSALAAAMALNSRSGSPASPPQTQAATVLYDFEGDSSATLTVRAGDRARVVAADTAGSGWTEVILTGSGQRGMVPTSYVDLGDRTASLTSVSSAFSASPRPPPSGASAAGGYVVALYDFEARDSDELACAKDDRIQVVSRDIGEGWLLGRLGGREGRLPASYVRDEA